MPVANRPADMSQETPQRWNVEPQFVIPGWKLRHSWLQQPFPDIMVQPMGRKPHELKSPWLSIQGDNKPLCMQAQGQWTQQTKWEVRLVDIPQKLFNFRNLFGCKAPRGSPLFIRHVLRALNEDADEAANTGRGVDHPLVFWDDAAIQQCARATLSDDEFGIEGAFDGSFSPDSIHAGAGCTIHFKPDKSKSQRMLLFQGSFPIDATDAYQAEEAAFAQLVLALEKLFIHFYGARDWWWERF